MLKDVSSVRHEENDKNNRNPATTIIHKHNVNTNLSLWDIISFFQKQTSANF